MGELVWREIWAWGRRGGSSNLSHLSSLLASEPWDGTPPGGRRFFISGPRGGRSLLYPVEAPTTRNTSTGDEEARGLFVTRRYAVGPVVPLIFEDAVGVLVVAEVLPEAADVVLDDAVAGEKPRRQAVEVVEPMSIPLELVDEPPDVRRQCTYHKTTPRHQQNLGGHVEGV